MANFAVAMVFSAVDKLSQSFDKWNRKGSDFEAGQKKHFKGASEAALSFKNVFEGSLAAKGVEKLLDVAKELPKQFEEFAERGEKIGKMAQTIGIAADEYQRLQYAAKMTEVDSASLDMALKKLNLGMGQLAKNQGPLDTGLRRIDPALRGQLKTAKSAGQAFLIVADAVAKTNNAQQRAAIVTAAFGKQGQALIPMLLKGKEGLAQYMVEADKYGTVLDDKAIEASEKFSDSLKKTRGMIDSLKSQALAGILEKLNPILSKFVDWVSANKDLIAQKIEALVTGIGKAFGIAYNFVKDFGPAILIAVGAFYAMRGAAVAFSVINGIIKTAQLVMFAYSAVTQGAATVQEAFNLVCSANPIGLIVTAIAVLIGLTVLLVTHWKQVTTALASAWEWIKKTGLAVTDFLLSPIRLLLDALAKIPIFSKIFSGPAATLDAMHANQKAGSAKNGIDPHDARKAALDAMHANQSKILTSALGAMHANQSKIPTSALGAMHANQSKIPTSALDAMHANQSKIPTSALGAMHANQSKIPTSALGAMHANQSKIPTATLDAMRANQSKIPTSALGAMHANQSKIPTSALGAMHANQSKIPTSALGAMRANQEAGSAKSKIFSGPAATLGAMHANQSKIFSGPAAALGAMHANQSKMFSGSAAALGAMHANQSKIPTSALGAMRANQKAGSAKNGIDPHDTRKAPNEAALAAARVGVTVPVNVDNSRAPGTTSTVRVAPQVRQELPGPAGGSNL